MLQKIDTFLQAIRNFLHCKTRMFCYHNTLWFVFWICYTFWSIPNATCFPPWIRYFGLSFASTILLTGFTIRPHSPWTSLWKIRFLLDARQLSSASLGIAPECMAKTWKDRWKRRKKRRKKKDAEKRRKKKTQKKPVYSGFDPGFDSDFDPGFDPGWKELHDICVLKTVPKVSKQKNQVTIQP